MKMRLIYAGASLLCLIALARPVAAQDYARFPTFEADGWTVTDKGEENCDADFASDGDTLLGFMGPYYHRSGEPASGSIIHLDDETHYALPKGDRHGEFSVQLIAGTANFAVSGFATDLGGSLVTDSGSLPTVVDLLAELRDRVILSAMVEGKQVYAIKLTGNRAAAKALTDCTAFITAQKRPGTKNGPELGPPKMVPLEALLVRPEPPSGAPPTALPDASPPNPVPPSSLY
ncbi:hypothetical protein [Sphingomonas psychrotolerans]|uniref:hypothetical protein n=1 Tax=Sphingomonas psychrotolerans TaxID=1327635 RepID=UPI001F43EF71|nr:hypothetical protein [Sphingomonas psychrotolerans]